MDTISHAAWGATIVRKSRLVWWAAFAAALPDLIPAAFGLLRYKRRYYLDMANLSFIDKPESAYMRIYHFTHSLVPITVLAVVLRFLAPGWWIIVIPYYSHVLLDIGTHRGVWATRIFYPFSDFHFEGYNWWKDWRITALNWTALIAINLIFFIT